MPRAQQDMKVLKFGGSSVGSAETIEKVIEIIRRSGPCAVVLSAMQGTTDALIEAGRTAERGDDGYSEILNNIGERHIETVRQLSSEGESSEILDLVKTAVKELENLCEGVRLVHGMGRSHARPGTPQGRQQAHGRRRQDHAEP